MFTQLTFQIELCQLLSIEGTDPENTLREAFIMFDEDGKGKLSAE